jgi:hypothetical protein
VVTNPHRMMTLYKLRTYSELMRFHSFEDRFEYLRIGGGVADQTFGGERWLNQDFYRSYQWKEVRDFVITRDLGQDLAHSDHTIFDRIIVHHMNPIAIEDLTDFNDDILNPEYLITTCHNTHNAIHYGDASLLPQPMVVRRPGDTTPWAIERRK